VEEGVIEKISQQYEFRGVETGQATLTVTVLDNNNKETPLLGSSTSYDVAQLCKFDAMNADKQYYETELEAEIFPQAGGSGDEALVEEVCTVYLKLTYTPSNKDRREELYELLNKATQQKASAVETLRQAATEEANRQLSAANPSRKLATKNPAVKAGFLSKAKAEPSKLQVWYARFLGPNSVLRQCYPIAKNYVVFFSFVGFMHFQGQVLSLPPPV
jgi:hypothetical protein